MAACALGDCGLDKMRLTTVEFWMYNINNEN